MLQRMDTKTWRPVPREPYGTHYEVSDHGDIRRRTRAPFGDYPAGRYVKRRDRAGYPCVWLSANGKKRAFPVHQLVAGAFLPPAPPGKPLVLHGDDNKWNAHVSNLRWGTHAENSAEMVAKQRQARGIGHGNAVLTDEQVLEIRRLYASQPKISQMSLAALFGVHQTSISIVVRRQGWKHLS
jgi:hypothetical protein